MSRTVPVCYLFVSGLRLISFPFFLGLVVSFGSCFGLRKGNLASDWSPHARIEGSRLRPQRLCQKRVLLQRLSYVYLRSRLRIHVWN